MATYDVTLGPIHVIITTTDEGAAQRIAQAIETEREHLFQCEGLKVATRRSDRDDAPDDAEAAKKSRARKSP